MQESAIELWEQDEHVAKQAQFKVRKQQFKFNRLENCLCEHWQLDSDELEIEIGMPTDCAAAKTEVQFIKQQIQIQDKAWSEVNAVQNCDLRTPKNKIRKQQAIVIIKLKFEQ